MMAALLIATPLAGARAAEVEVLQAWARATPAGADTGAVYLTLRAHGADRLIGIDTPAAEMAMLHESATSGGVATMRDVDAVPLPDGVAVALRPGGLHVMLMGLAQRLVQGSRFTATLRFVQAPPRTVSVVVAGPGAVAPP